MKKYIVTSYKFGEKDKHSYVVGVFNKKLKAIKEACKEEQYRGGNKYGCEVLEFYENKTHKEYSKVIRKCFDKESVKQYLES